MAGEKKSFALRLDPALFNAATVRPPRQRSGASASPCLRLATTVQPASGPAQPFAGDSFCPEGMLERPAEIQVVFDDQ